MSVLVGNSKIELRVLGTNVSFTPPGTNTRFVDSASELIHFQICVNSDGNPTLYINCGGGGIVSSSVVIPSNFDSLNLRKVFLSDAPMSVNSIYTVIMYDACCVINTTQQ